MGKRDLNNRDYIIPKFKINKNGFVLCKNHSAYDIMKYSTYDFALNFLTFKNLTCITCQNYKNDKCFFPKSEITKILDDMSLISNQFKCSICKRNIRNIFTILRKFKRDQKKNQDGSLICYRCLKVLKKENPQKGFHNYAKLTLLYSLINLAGILALILFFPLFLNSSFLIFSIFFTSIFFLIMAYFFYYYARLAKKYFNAVNISSNSF